MYDIKPTVVAALQPIGVTVSDNYPASLADTPRITLREAANTEGAPAVPGVLSDVAIQVDIWHSDSTGALAAQVNTALNALGLRRDMAHDLDDPSGAKRKTTRYRGVVDARSGRVSQ